MDRLQETITFLSELIEKILEETLDQSYFTDLTQQQFHYLKIIVRMKNPTISDIASELGLTKPTVTVLADKLSEKGYIKRIHSGKDRRVIHLQTDKKGKKIGDLRNIANETLAGKIREGLTEKEAATLTDLLRKAVQDKYNQGERNK
jgi:DNA-binding MarR family transcriptional regulator